jgi:hypothetical protein
LGEIKKPKRIIHVDIKLSGKYGRGDKAYEIINELPPLGDCQSTWIKMVRFERIDGYLSGAANRINFKFSL